ncbi:MAG: hypothetical protein JSV88_00335 [Candidatus Aminicenantes bacterium]|nr:MAG: hypothetical protein JSV88_00335 [Candidatus Aminicenantes bacterium]
MMMKRKILLFSFFLIITLFLSGQDQEDKLLKRLEYEVSVNAQLVPIFAMDSQGNPVYDLEKEEIELYADGKLAEIIYFARYQVEEDEEQIPGRINLIILDTLISNKNTMVPAQAIVMGIIDRASPGDAFVILESNQVTGFRYVIGPEKDKKKLSEAIKKIVKHYMRRRVLLTMKLPKAEDYSDPKAYELALRMYGLHYNKTQREREKYQRDIWIFSDSLKQLKYALKTITQPKTFYLISAGHIPGAMGNTATYYRFLEAAAKAINYGGCMFYLVNPLKQKYPTGGTGLKFMADEVGGKFITGTSTEDIVKKVKKSTSAYYELAFYLEKKPDKKNRIQLKCQRKGIELITINYSERSTPYHEMKPLEKKLFALNVVNGGSWSRMVARVGKVNYKTLSNDREQSKNHQLKTIEITIPPTIRNRQLDFFLVNIDPKTQKANIGMTGKRVGKTETLRFQARANRKQYFVIIEPYQPFCIYNQVD